MKNTFLGYLIGENGKKHLAEFIGTFALVFCGTGAIIVNVHTDGSLGLIGIAFAFAGIITAMVYVFGNISGTHINPAVTIALAVGGLFSKKEVFPYVIAQVLGAFLASGLLVVLFPDTPTMGETLPSGTVMQSFIMEVVATFFLMLTILGITSQADKETTALAGIVIGIVIVGLIVVSGPISGGSFNPARSIAPAVIAGNLTSIWVYLLAPILGAVMAMLSWKFVSEK